jgi:hypothetical protein
MSENYFVFYFVPDNSYDLVKFINTTCEQKNARLVTCDNGYYIFEPAGLLINGNIEQKSDKP